jgi:MinD-like ATPase involved in chromosome partitioning or flagellar assembly
MVTLIPTPASFEGGRDKTNNFISPENYLAASGRRVLLIDLDINFIDEKTKIGGSSDA